MTLDLLAAASACAGGATGLLAFVLGGREPARTAPPDARRDALRAKSAVYRDCEGVVTPVAAVLRRVVAPALERTAGHLDALGEADWKPEEYVAAKVVATLPVVAGVGMATFLVTGPLEALAAAGALLALVPWLVLRSVRARAAARVHKIRGRLPNTLDLMALVLEAGGGTLYDCLDLGAAENPDHPLGDEFRRVVQGAAKGAPPVELLTEMGRRLGDPDVAEVTLAICTSEVRGLPLKESLRAVAARMRERQVQWMEKASEQAKVHITWPTMLVMLGCLLIVVAPLVIEAIVAGAN